MRRFLTNTALFLLISILFYPLLVFVWGKITHPRLHPNLQYILGTYGHHFTRSQEVRNKQNVDILFLGSSHAYRGFDPRFFEKQGLTVFNLGSSSQSPLQTNLLLKRYLDKLNPKLVIYEVYPVTFDTEGVESSLDILSNDRIDIHSLQMAFKINHIKVYNALLYSFFAHQGKAYTSFKEDVQKEDDTYINGGFVEKDMAYYTPTKVDSFSWKMRDDQMKAFEENIQMFTDKGRELILVQAPITAARYSRARNNEWFDRTMASYGIYINFNDSLSLSDTVHFYDEHHLNQLGVEIFNEELIRILKDSNQDVF